MSLVGPPGFVARYLEEVPGYAERFLVPPGLTGLGSQRRIHDSPQNKRYDLAYLANWRFSATSRSSSGPPRSSSPRAASEPHSGRIWLAEGASHSAVAISVGPRCARPCSAGEVQVGLGARSARAPPVTPMARSARPSGRYCAPRATRRRPRRICGSRPRASRCFRQQLPAVRRGPRAATAAASAAHEPVRAETARRQASASRRAGRTERGEPRPAVAAGVFIGRERAAPGRRGPPDSRRARPEQEIEEREAGTTRTARASAFSGAVCGRRRMWLPSTPTPAEGDEAGEPNGGDLERLAVGVGEDRGRLLVEEADPPLEQRQLGGDELGDEGARPDPGERMRGGHPEGGPPAVETAGEETVDVTEGEIPDLGRDPFAHRCGEEQHEPAGDGQRPATGSHAAGRRARGTGQAAAPARRASGSRRARWRRAGRARARASAAAGTPP